MSEGGRFHVVRHGLIFLFDQEESARLVLRRFVRRLLLLFVSFWPKEKSPTKSRTGRNTNNGTDTNWKRRTFRLALQLVELPAASRDLLPRRAPKSSKWPRRFPVGPAMCFGGFSRSFLQPSVQNKDGTYGSRVISLIVTSPAGVVTDAVS